MALSALEKLSSMSREFPFSSQLRSSCWIELCTSKGPRIACLDFRNFRSVGDDTPDVPASRSKFSIYTFNSEGNVGGYRIPWKVNFTF